MFKSDLTKLREIQDKWHKDMAEIDKQQPTDSEILDWFTKNCQALTRTKPDDGWCVYVGFGDKGEAIYAYGDTPIKAMKIAAAMAKE